MKTQKNKLLLSAISLFLCFAMLIGTTYAWFTDSVTSEGNIIQTGNLQVGMQWSNTLLTADSNEWNDVNGAIFTYNNWEPGYTDVKYVKITNNGSLNLKWKLNIEAEAQVSALADIIDVYYVNPVTVSISSLDGLTSAGKLTKVLEEKVNSTGALTPEQSTILAIAFHMPEDAGNEYQNLSLCDGGFSINLIATQETGESDSFGDNYDIGADWGEDTVSFSASSVINSADLVYGALSTGITLGTDSGISATVPAGVKLAEGATSLALSVKTVETDSNITIGEGEDAKSIDVHIEGIAADNTVPMIVNLGAIFKPGLNETELKIYHIENDVPVLMTRVESAADFARHNQYTYNSETGEVSIYVASFSVFSALHTAADVWDGTSDISWYNSTDIEFTLMSAEQLAGFRDIVDGKVENVTETFAGKIVKLGVDIDLNGELFDPIGFGYTYNKDSDTAFMGIFDGGNHTIYNLYQNGWDLDPNPGVYDTYTYSTAGGGLFASIENATIKNLVVSGANIVFECVDIGIVCGYAQGNCHFENIVVTDSQIANYNRATGGLLGEVCYGSYETDTTLGFSHTFKNIVIDTSVTVSSLWGSFDTLCGGVIGGKWGDATVKMENVISACVLDVFSDVTAAYQWYAYRRCGMLIGHTEQNSPKKALNAAAEFLVCENVKVYYGDWINYEYYEFENQESGTGRNYPWVRAEQGLNNGAFSNPRYGVPTHNGVKVTEDPNMENLKTDYTPIVFGQLYGGGQGVYGCNEHDGVETIYNGLENTKTVYVVNDQGLDGLMLQYWFAKGGDTWTTNIDGVDMSSMATTSSTYKITLPAYADGFSILHNGVVIGTFTLADLTEGGQYDLDATSHNHVYTDGVCACGETCKHTGGTATCISQAVCTTCGLKYGGTASSNHVDNANSLSWTVSASGHSKVCRCGVTLESASHSGGTANCQTQATCSTCGVKYGNTNPSNHVPSTYRWIINEHNCYQICGCGATVVSATGHAWNDETCSRCQKKQNLITLDKPDGIYANGQYADIKVTFNSDNAVHSINNYRIYLYYGGSAQVMSYAANSGIHGFTANGSGLTIHNSNYSSLPAYDYYNIIVVDESAGGAWVATKRIQLKNPGVVQHWSAQDIYNIWVNNGKEAKTGLTATLNNNNKTVSLKVTGNGICTALNSGGRLQFKTTASGYMIIKYKNNNWRNIINIHPFKGAYQSPVSGAFHSGSMSRFETENLLVVPSGISLFEFDIFANRTPEAGNILEIEYIAIVSNGSYFANLH